MKILAFDTSNNIISVAISSNGIILSSVVEYKNSSQAEKIIPIIENCLSAVNLIYDDLDYIVCTNGPAGFTGIRIGLSVLKAIKFAKKNIKCFTVSNFEIEAYRAVKQVKFFDKIIVMLDARRDQTYYQYMDRNYHFSEPKLYNNNAIPIILKELGGIKICVGNALNILYDSIINIENLTILPRFTSIKATNICDYVKFKLDNNFEFSDIINPLYLRESDAQTNLTKSSL